MFDLCDIRFEGLTSVNTEDTSEEAKTVILAQTNTKLIKNIIPTKNSRLSAHF
jgi:hypothetical protein